MAYVALNNIDQISIEGYLLLDAARVQESLEHARSLNENHSCLYKGASKEDLINVAPFLFNFKRNEKFAGWFQDECWGNASGIILYSGSDFDSIYSHFRKFLIVKTEDNKELYFRFYDPRVLKIFLPTCDKQQIIEFFGPVESFIVEGETKEQAIRFRHQKGELKQEILPVEAVFGEAVLQTTLNT